jgi:hypothetical protein
MPVQVAGPPGGLGIEIKASKPHVVIGDSLSIFCTITLPDSVQAEEPYMKDKSLFIDIDKQWMKEEKTSAGNIRHFGFLAYILSADTLKVGPFVLEYTTNSGRKGEILSNVLEIRAAGAAEKAEAPLKPNRGPLGIPAKGIPGWFLAVILIILIAAVILYFLKFRKRKVSPPPVIYKPLDEIEEFERIRSLHLLEKGQVKEFYLMVSNTLRGFIHRNMGFEAMYSTTYEIKRNLSRMKKYSDASESFEKLLEESDMVKFAKYIPPADISSTVIDRAEAPVRKVLEQIALEKERARLAAEESKNIQTSEAAGTTHNETVSAHKGEI